MNIINSASQIILVIALIGFTMFYFYLYHSIFQVIYFNNTCLEIIFEIIGCLVVAMITVGGIMKILGGIWGGVISLVRGIILLIAFLLKVALFIGVLALIYYVIRLLIKRK